MNCPVRGNGATESILPFNLLVKTTESQIALLTSLIGFASVTAIPVTPVLVNSFAWLFSLMTEQEVSLSLWFRLLLLAKFAVADLDASDWVEEKEDEFVKLLFVRQLKEVEEEAWVKEVRVFFDETESRLITDSWFPFLSSIFLLLS